MQRWFLLNKCLIPRFSVCSTCIHCYVQCCYSISVFLESLDRPRNNVLICLSVNYHGSKEYVGRNNAVISSDSAANAADDVYRTIRGSNHCMRIIYSIDGLQRAAAVPDKGICHHAAFMFDYRYVRVHSMDGMLLMADGYLWSIVSYFRWNNLHVRASAFRYVCNSRFKYWKLCCMDK